MLEDALTISTSFRRNCRRWGVLEAIGRTGDERGIGRISRKQRGRRKRWRRWWPGENLKRVQTCLVLITI